MTSSRPYLIRGLYEWIVDNGHVPHLLVDATDPRAVVPEHAVRDGQIVLNVGPSAVQGLQLGNEDISFSARFGGQPMQVHFPVSAVKAIYDRENGKGMMFAEEEIPAEEEETHTPEAAAEQDEQQPEEESGEGKKKGRPHLKVIK